MLCYFGRKKVAAVLGSGANALNPHRSWFGHRAWIYVVGSWAVLCVFLVTFNYIYDSAHSSNDQPAGNSSALVMSL
jgi:hypothetical protein